MMLVDVHAHLDFFENEKIAEVIKNAEKNKVKVIINNGTDKKSNRKTIELSKKYSLIKPALGLHPEFIEKFEDFLIEEELKFIEKNADKIIAIGEIGLDYHWVKDEKQLVRQKALFERFLELAKSLDKPVIIHSREAEKDTVEMLSRSKIKNVVLHCFNGDLKLVKDTIKNGWMLSIPTNVVYNEHFQQLTDVIPLSHILTETDAPYLSPFKDKQNEPSFIIESIKKIAEIKRMNEEEVANAIFSNYQKMFL